MSLRHRVTAVVTLWVVACASAANFALAARADDEWLGPNEWGSVVGSVYDATSGAPIKDAQVVIYHDGAFAREGRTTDRTNAAGQYECEAMLGRVSSSLEGGSLLASLFASALLTAAGAATGMGGPTIVSGPAAKQTVRMDVTRLTIRTRKLGYRPFEGQVLCREVDPGKYGVRMEPVLLVPSGSSHVSCTGLEWSALRISGVSVDPPVVQAGSKAVVTVRVRGCLTEGASGSSPGSLLWTRLGGDGKRKAQIRFQALSSLWRKPIALKPHEQDGNEVVLRQEFSLPATLNPAVYAVGVRVDRSDYEVARAEQFVPPWVEADAPQRLLRAFSEAGRHANVALLDVIGKSSEKELAVGRLGVYRLQSLGLASEAIANLKQLCSSPEARRDDFALLGTLSEQAQDTAGAAAAWRRALELTTTGDREWVLARCAQALAANGMGQAALDLALPVMENVKRKEQPWQLPPALAVAIDRAYLAINQPEAATYTDYFVKRRPEFADDEAVKRFSWDRRQAQEEAAIEASPGDPQVWAEHGYTLVEAGGSEAAVAPLRKALELDPTLARARAYLAFALAHTGRTEPDPALEAAALAFHVPDDRKDMREKSDFILAHVYAIALCRLALQQRLAGEPASETTLLRGRQLLGRAVECGRGSIYDPGMGRFVHYQSPSPSYVSTYIADPVVFVRISGFAYPEAESDLAILTSYRALDVDPDNPVDWVNLSRAFAELGQEALAESALGKVRELRYASTDVDYLSAVVALQGQDREGAVFALRAVLADNPTHPFAHLDLARLNLTAGDLASAAACLRAHAAAVYGDTTAGLPPGPAAVPPPHSEVRAQPGQAGRAVEEYPSQASAQTDGQRDAADSLAASLASYQERLPALGKIHLDQAQAALAALTAVNAPPVDDAMRPEATVAEREAVAGPDIQAVAVPDIQAVAPPPGGGSPSAETPASAGGAEIPQDHGQGAGLHGAVQRGDIAGIDEVLAAGEDINARDAEGRTPLHSAVRSGRKDVAQYLIAKGADVDAITPSGYTPLHFAAELGLSELAEALLAKGGSLKAQTNEGDTALHLAVGAGQKDTTDLLLANGADVNARNATGDAPLHRAVEVGTREMVDLLLSKGADVRASDDSGLTVLHIAASHGSSDLLEVLLNRGADVNASCASGMTPLHAAAISGDVDSVVLLIAKGAAVNARDASGTTPWRAAIESQQTSAARAIRKRGGRA